MGVLVTGGSGFVGLNVIEWLLERGEEAVAFATAPVPEAAGEIFARLPGRFHFVPGDVRDRAAVERALAEHGIDKVVHAAAITSGADRERTHAREIIEANLGGTVEVLEAARRHAVRRFVYLSSNAVYGRVGATAGKLMGESTPARPESLYAIGKFAAERASLRYKALWGMDVVAARLGSVFGPWEYPTGVRDTLSPILQATRLAVRGAEAILPGPGSRDWVYARDVAEAVALLLDLKTPRYDLYNVSGGSPFTVESWCQRLKAAFPRLSYRIAAKAGEANLDFHAVPDRPPMSMARLEEDTGFRPRFDLDGAAADYLEWIGRHRSWVE